MGRSRLLAGVAIAALLGAGCLSVIGIRSLGDGPDVVLTADDVAAPTPSTVAPVAPATPSTLDTTNSDIAADPTVGESAPAGSPTSTGSPTPTGASPGSSSGTVFSPLARLLGEQSSAVPADVEPRPRPIGMEIDAIDVTPYPIRPVGLEADGQLQVPDETEIGWYQYGATAGRPGSTVLAAHVSWNRTVGPFARLATLEPGNQIAVTLDDGTIRRYEVFERALYGKDELPRDRIWTNTGPETLVLITCGGDFNPEIRRFRQNIVVFAAPVG